MPSHKKKNLPKGKKNKSTIINKTTSEKSSSEINGTTECISIGDSSNSEDSDSGQSSVIDFFQSSAKTKDKMEEEGTPKSRKSEGAKKKSDTNLFNGSKQKNLEKNSSKEPNKDFNNGINKKDKKQGVVKKKATDPNNKSTKYNKLDVVKSETKVESQNSGSSRTKTKLSTNTILNQVQQVNAVDLKNGELQKSETKERNNKSTKNDNSSSTVIDDETDEVIEVTSEEKNKPKKPIKNAFSFMMDSRHKVIGNNSPGKEAENDDTTKAKNGNKGKLAARKALFENWANAKGAKKRKAIDEEIGETIDRKLKKRAKHLKQLLTFDKTPIRTENKDKYRNLSEVENSKTSINILDSDDDNNDFMHSEPKIATTVTTVTNDSSSECRKSSDLQQKGTTKKHLQQTELSSFFGTSDTDLSSTPIKSKESINAKSSKKENKDDKFNNDMVVEVMELKENHIDIKPITNKAWKLRLNLNIEDKVLKELIDNRHTSKKKHIKKDLLSSVSTNIAADISNKLNKKEKSSDDTNTIEVENSSDSESCTIEQSDIKLVSKSKLAPVFLKAVPKPKLDHNALLARKQFLESELPDKLKKHKEKQEKLYNRISPIFPSVSHITVQPSAKQKNGSIDFWNLPACELDLQTNTPFVPVASTLKSSFLLGYTKEEATGSKLKWYKTDFNITEEMGNIKISNPNYPVNKSFRLCRDAYFNSNIEEDSPKKQKKSKNKTKTSEIQSKPPYKLWTDVYQPHKSDEMFSNYSNVKIIKTWLKRWLDFSSDTKNFKRKRRGSYSSSASDFEGVDGDEGITEAPRNTLILYGPHGSGKTSAIHALCSELGIAILESNASSRRTGKSLLQELQEISNTHEIGLVKDFVTSNNQIAVAQKKTHLVLVEDVDIVFDQDESFISAVTQLITTSKLPIALITTDINSLLIKKLVSDHIVIQFTPVSPKMLAPWLQILCLIEGICVTKQFVSELLQDYNGDVRCTLLQLQYLIQGNAESKPFCQKLNGTFNGLNDIDEANISSVAKDDSISEMVDHHVTDFVLEYCDIFKPLDLGRIWWSIPQALNMPSLFSSQEGNTEKSCNGMSQIGAETDSKVFLQVSNLFNAFAMTDVFYKNVVDCDLEPVHKNSTPNLKRSLEDTPATDLCYFHRDLTIEVSHRLVKGYLTTDETFSNVKLYRGADEKRWRSKQYKCEEKLLQAVPSIHYLNRAAVTDFLSTLRTISKSEMQRSLLNEKRNYRFYNYLSGLGIRVNDSILKTVNEIF